MGGFAETNKRNGYQFQLLYLQTYSHQKSDKTRQVIGGEEIVVRAVLLSQSIAVYWEVTLVSLLHLKKHSHMRGPTVDEVNTIFN